MGLAGSLLVFTGLWHALEWLMGGRNRDTMRLIPVGLIYTVLGFLIVTFQGLPVVLWVALFAVGTGLSAAFTLRNTLEIRPWVLWSFIAIDLAILAGLFSAVLG